AGPELEVDRERDARAVRVVRDEDVRAVLRIDRDGRVGERRLLAHADGPEVAAPRRVGDGVHDSAETAHERAALGHAGPRLDEWTVVLREPLRDPQFTREVHAI